MEVSKFIIDDNEVYVKDAEGRNLIAGLSDDVKTAQNTADGAVTLAGTAQSTADGKLSPGNAWKIGTISITEENVTINSLSNHTFSIDIPTGVSNVIVLNARSSDTTRTLVLINFVAISGKIYVIMSNQSENTMTATMTIEVIYAYK